MSYRIYIFLTLTFLFACNVCFAQSIEVDTFMLAPTQYGGAFVKDINNRPCALIKVQIVNENVSFEGDVIKCEEMGQNEWRVWIWESAKYLTIKSDSFLPLKINFNDHGIKLVGHQTYVLRLVQSQETKKTKRDWKCKPEKFTMEIGVIGGTNLGLTMDFTASCFLIGFGVDWIVIAPELNTTTSLVNSGYTGNFTKTTTTVLSGSRTNIFLDIGTYFKFFSLSCQVGLLCGTTVNRNAKYDGWGYGLVDGDFEEYWGHYEQRSLANTTSAKELHLTLTPQVKGYIPVGRQKSTSLSVGLGCTLIPTLNYYTGFSGSLGVHFRF